MLDMNTPQIRGKHDENNTKRKEYLDNLFYYRLQRLHSNGHWNTSSMQETPEAWNTMSNSILIYIVRISYTKNDE